MEDDATLVSASLQEMSEALSKAEPGLIREFLLSILTPSEADEIAKRWALVKEIANGRPQREIARDMGLSLCKITRGSRELKKEGSSFKRMLELAGFRPSPPQPRRRPRKRSEEAISRPARQNIPVDSFRLLDHPR